MSLHEITHLVTKQIPEPVQNAAEELSVAQQHSGEHGGPHVLSGDTESQSLSVFILAQRTKPLLGILEKINAMERSISLVGSAYLCGGFAREVASRHWQKHLSSMLTA